MKKIIIFLAIMSVLIAAGITIAKAKEKNADNPLPLEKAVFIHYKKDFAKPPKGGGGSTSCYGFLSKGAKIKQMANLVIHPDLDTTAVLGGVLEWDSHTQTLLFGSTTIDASADWDSEMPDGRNEFSFGNYPKEGVIAITIVWGYFSGPPQAKEIIEFDVMFDSDFNWGDASNDPSLMDLQNIITHEIGHGIGLADVYNSACDQVTMYGYSNYGELNKRSIEQQDIKGLQTLYGI